MQAMLPALTAGMIVGAVVFFQVASAPGNIGIVMGMLWLPLGWVVLYGCAFHAAGFFMPRGMRLFGWGFVVVGCGLFAAGLPDQLRPADMAYGVMGLFFGLLHLAYGVYLYFTEKRRDET
jgi:hypothetical protein